MLAARVERARALFGPGGFLPTRESAQEPFQEVGPGTCPEPTDKFTATSAWSQPTSQTEAEKSMLQPKTEQRLRLKSVPKLIIPSKSTPDNIGDVKLEKSEREASAGTSESEQHRENSLVSARHELESASGGRQGRTVALRAMSALGLTQAPVLDTTGREELAESVEGRTMRPATRTIVTFTILGGRAEGRGFSNLQQIDKVSPGCHAINPSIRMYGLALPRFCATLRRVCESPRASRATGFRQFSLRVHMLVFWPALLLVLFARKTYDNSFFLRYPIIWYPVFPIRRPGCYPKRRLLRQWLSTSCCRCATAVATSCKAD